MPIVENNNLTESSTRSSSINRKCMPEPSEISLDTEEWNETGLERTGC